MGFIKTMLWPFFQGEKKVVPTPVTPPAPPKIVVAIFPPAPTSLDEPPFPPLVSNTARQTLFGAFDYEPEPMPGNEEHIRILGDWTRRNILWVPIPQLRGIPGVEHQDVSPPGMWFHRLGAHQLQGMWNEWEQAGLLHYVKTFEGSFAPRFVRGSSTNLSNHCFGNAFDINYAWNTLGATPAQWGQRGSVRELVPIAIKWGFYWGGFYHNRKDGMHFEVARLMP